MSETIQFTVNTIAWPALHTPFIQVPIENATDVVTLDGTMYTDFVNQRRSWRLHWDFLCSTDYAKIKAAYDSQFSDEDYVDVTCPFYALSNTKMRMYLNEQDIRSAGDRIMGIDVTFVEQSALS